MTSTARARGPKIRERRKAPSFQGYVTPWFILRALEEELGPCALDAAADEHNAKARRFYTVNENGLREPWIDWTFYNPPYATQGEWIEKAARERRRGVRSVGLVKVATGASYWRRNVELGETHFFEGRMRFLAPRGGLRLVTKSGVRVFREGQPIDGADFDSALVFLGPGFRPLVVRYRDARTGRVIPMGHTLLEVRR